MTDVDYVSRGLRLIGHSDLGGEGNGMHINVSDGYAYYGHMNEVGTSIVDVRDPRAPRVVARIPAPENTHGHKVQVVDDLLLVNRERLPDAWGGNRSLPWVGGLDIYDISNPVDPRPIGHWKASGRGVHRMTYWEPPYAFLAAGLEGFGDKAEALVVLDLSDPSAPQEVSRWWLPGMAPDEEQDWPRGKVARLHHGIPREGRLYCGWWDLGVVILDVRDVEHPKLLSHLTLGEGSEHTHSVSPIPGRDVAVVTDEASDDDRERGIQKDIRLIDIRDDRYPRVVSVLPRPEGEFVSLPGRFGPHNVHENRPGSYQDADHVYVAYFNAGVRVYNITDSSTPFEAAHFLPGIGKGTKVQINDLYVDDNRLIYASDRFGGGLYILEMLD